MTKKDKKPVLADENAAVPDVTAIDKKRSRKGRPAETSGDGKRLENRFDVVGKIESFRVTSDGPGSPALQFTLKGKDNRGKPVTLDAGDPYLANVMAQAVMTAASRGARIAVRLSGQGDGPSQATAIEIRF